MERKINHFHSLFFINHQLCNLREQTGRNNSVDCYLLVRRGSAENIVLVFH